ncbi:MAG: glycosyltransferase family 2 protein [Muribaculaceae bacterium]|nr:glycosyltransferase family 2 protein [Muribaculaceae bacterium]
MRLAIVIPCYNEQEVLPLTVERLLKILDTMVGRNLVDAESFILCSNDGSKDATWETIAALNARDSRVKGISLAHNRGHQFALLAGLESVVNKCDAAISIDADLQDDPEAIIRMVEAFHQGNEIVYGVRSNRDTDSWFKRTTAHAFYRFQRRMGLETVYDHADYRLLSARALEMLCQYSEANMFMRGIVPQLGLKSAVVTYERAARAAGESKYPLKRMMSFAIDGITSFSARPMRMIFLTGLFLNILSIGVAIYVFISYFGHPTLQGWTSIMLSIWFLGSLILMCIGIVGEYVGKIFLEVKHRPRYFISDKID